MNNWFVEWTQRGERTRVLLDRRLTIGRSVTCDITLDDPYVSRTHCTIEPGSECAVVDASRSLNQIRVNGRDVEAATLTDGDAWLVGNTAMRVVGILSSDDESTLRMDKRSRPSYVLRCSTRELIGPAGMVLQFSRSEFLAFETLARRYPDAASHHELGGAIWPGMGFDQYQLHRLMQLVRRRVGDQGEMVKAVRGYGYRLSDPVTIA